MTRLLAPAFLALLASPALAGPDCSGIEQTMPMWEIIKTFEEDEGGLIEIAQVSEENCYEIYGQVDGTRVEVRYDPSNGAVLERLEG